MNLKRQQPLLYLLYSLCYSTWIQFDYVNEELAPVCNIPSISLSCICFSLSYSIPLLLCDRMYQTLFQLNFFQYSKLDWRINWRMLSSIFSLTRAKFNSINNKHCHQNSSLRSFILVANGMKIAWFYFGKIFHCERFPFCRNKRTKKSIENKSSSNEWNARKWTPWYWLDGWANRLKGWVVPEGRTRPDHRPFTADV